MVGYFECKSLAASNKTVYTCNLGEVNGQGDNADVFTLIEEMCLAFPVKILIFGFLENLEVLLEDEVMAIFMSDGLVPFEPWKCVIFPIKF